MNTLTSLIPVPRMLPLGGEMVQVAELTIRDLATLQSILDGLEADPWESIRESLATADARQRAAILSDAWERVERGAPQVGTPQGNAFFSTAEGASLLLWVAARRFNPKLTPERVASLFVKATGAEIGVIWRVIYGISPAQILERHVFAPELLNRSLPGGQDISWPEAIDRLSRDRGWTYEYIYGLTISEYANARRNGKPKELGVVLGSIAEAARMQEIQHRWFYGEEDGTDRT